MTSSWSVKSQQRINFRNGGDNTVNGIVWINTVFKRKKQSMHIRQKQSVGMLAHSIYVWVWIVTFRKSAGPNMPFSQKVEW